MKHRVGDIDSFCSKLGQNDLEGILKTFCKHKCHTKYGSRSGSGHERSPKSKIIFRACDTWFMVTFTHRIQKSRSFCNRTLCQSKTENSLRSYKVRPYMNSQASLGSFKVKFSNGSFWIKNVYSGVSLTSGFQKCSFYFCVGSRNAKKNAIWKKWRHHFRYMCEIAVDSHLTIK